MSIHLPFADYPNPPAGSQRYRAFARIGRGGMAEVFLAVAPGAAVTKLVVLKRIWPELASDPAFVAMFLDEARLSARMSHPNVVQTFDVIEQAGRLTMAMEYLDGQPLTRVLNRLSASGTISDLTLAQRLRIVVDLLAGLDHVHELTDYKGQPLGVVHRDVSPHNVFITYDGHVKLMDFGVAKTMAGAHLSRPGTIKGKLAYMAPDQLRAGPLDRRADIFSVGVILWEMLSGRRLWPGRTEVSIVRHLSNSLPLPTLPADLHLPAGLAEVCQRAMALDPAERFSTAAEMQDALQRLLPAVADSYARHLGKIVSVAFAAERAERQAVIDHHLLNTGAGDDFDISVRTGLNDDGGVDEEGDRSAAHEADAPVGNDDDAAPVDDALSRPTPPLLDEAAMPVTGRSSPLWRWGAAGVAVVAVPTIVVLLVTLVLKRTERDSLEPQSQPRPNVATIVIDARPPAVGDPVPALALTPNTLEPVMPPPAPLVERFDTDGDNGGAAPVAASLEPVPQKKKPFIKRPGLFSTDVGQLPRASRRARHRRGIDATSPFIQ